MNINDIARLMNGTVDCNFNTAIKDTRGYLSINDDGSLKNVGRHWYNFFSKPTDARKNMNTRIALLDAISHSGFDQDTVNRLAMDLGIHDNEIGSKPLSRREVKQILVNLKRDNDDLKNNSVVKYNQNMMKFVSEKVTPKMKELGIVYESKDEHMTDGSIINETLLKPILNFASRRMADVKMGELSKKTAKTKIHEYCDVFLLDDPEFSEDFKVFGDKITRKVMVELKKMIEEEFDLIIDETVQLKPEKEIEDKEIEEKNKNEMSVEDEYGDMNDSDLSDD